MSQVSQIPMQGSQGLRRLPGVPPSCTLNGPGSWQQLPHHVSSSSYQPHHHLCLSLAFIPSISLLHRGHRSLSAASTPCVWGCLVGARPHILGQSLQCHLGGERDVSGREAGHTALAGAPHRDPACAMQDEPTVKPASHADGGEGAPLAPPSTGTASKPLGSSSRLLCKCGFHLRRPGGATCTQSRPSHAGLCKPQRELFQLVGLLPGSQVPSSSSSSPNGCQSLWAAA